MYSTHPVQLNDLFFIGLVFVDIETDIVFNLVFAFDFADTWIHN